MSLPFINHTKLHLYQPMRKKEIFEAAADKKKSTKSLIKHNQQYRVLFMERTAVHFLL